MAWRQEDPVLRTSDESNALRDDFKDVVEARRAQFLRENDATALRARIAECERTLASLTQRYHIHARKTLEAELESFQKQLKDQPLALERWEARVKRYTDAYAAASGAGGAVVSSSRKRKAGSSGGGGDVLPPPSPPPPPLPQAAAPPGRKAAPGAAGEARRTAKASVRNEFVATTAPLVPTSAKQPGLALQPLAPVVDEVDVCDKCNVPMVIMGSEALLGCRGCGRTRVYVQATSYCRAYREDGGGGGGAGFNYKYSYKRSHHMQDWIHLIQGKESAEVPLAVIRQVMEEAAVRRLPASAMDVKQTRELLKALKLRKYYDSAAQIAARITGVPPPHMTLDQESQCLAMFNAVEQLWPVHCPADRRNFLSYSYCLFKFCELMGWDYLLPNFSLLKGKDKLQKQDAIWKKICGDLNWQFIPSI